MAYYCDFDAAASMVDGLIWDLVKERFGDMPRGEVNAVREFAFRDFMHYLANKAGIYAWRRFDQDRARLRLCLFIQRHWPKVREVALHWFTLWSFKWNQRVRLVFSEEEFKRATQQQSWNSQLEAFLSKVDLLQLRLFTVGALLRAGEVAGLEQIAEYIIRDEANALLAERGGLEGALEGYRRGELAERILKRTRALRSHTEPLLLLRVDFGQ